MTKECNIIGPLKSFVELKKSLFTIFVDGGMLYSKGFTNFTSIGDSDSYTHLHEHQLSKDKDRNDLFHGLKLVPKDCKILHARGFYGARMDHFIINLGEIDHFLRQNETIVKIYDENALAIVAFNTDEYVANIEGIFSIFSFEDNVWSISGNCKYKTELEYTNLLGRSANGLSNIGYGNVKISAKGPIFLFYNHNV